MEYHAGSHGISVGCTSACARPLARLLGLLLLLLSAAAVAQTPPGTRVSLELKDGTRLSGRLLEESGPLLLLETPYGRLRIPRDAVAGIEVVEPAAPPPAVERRPAPPPPAGPSRPELRSIVTPEQVAQAAGRLPTRRLVMATAPEFAFSLLPDLVERFASLYGVRAVVWEPTEGGQRARFERNPAGFPEEVVIRSLPRERALGLLRSGEVDLVLAHEAGGEEPEDLEEHVVALDAVVPLLHPDNPLPYISRRTLADLLAGRIDDWSALGRGPRPVRRVAPGPELAISRFVRERLPGLARMAPGTLYVRDPDDLMDELFADPGTLAYGSLLAAGGAHVPAIVECGIVHPPESYRIRAEDWPLTQRIDAYLRADAVDAWEDVFLLFLLSARGEAAMADFRLEPLTIRPATAEEQRAWVSAVLNTPQQVPEVRRAFLDLARSARRLTVVFRFETGSAELDERARDDVGRLALWLESEGIDPARLVLAGYADPRGGYQSNLALARTRAESVAAALADVGIGVGEVVAFGEEITVACDTDPWGLHLDRRVEAWLRTGG